MPTPERLKAYAAVVEAGRYVEAIRDYYHEDASVQENVQSPRVGRAALMAREARALDRFTIRTVKVEAFPSGGDEVAIHSVFELTNSEGRCTRLDQMSLQRWRGDRIAEERFFYDPVQRTMAYEAG